MKKDKEVSYDEMMDNMQNYSPKNKPPLSVEELLKTRILIIAPFPEMETKNKTGKNFWIMNQNIIMKLNYHNAYKIITSQNHPLNKTNNENI